MPVKTRVPEHVAQAAEHLRRIYEDRNPPTTFRERKTLTDWLHKSAKRDGKIEYAWRFGKAELLLKMHEAGVHVLPITEHVNALYAAAKGRPQEAAATPAVKPPKFQPTEKQKETADALRRIYKPRSSADGVSQSIRNRATRALKHLRRIAAEAAPGRDFPEHTDAASLYFEGCRVRSEGSEAAALRAALESAEAMAYEARRSWEQEAGRPEAKKEPAGKGRTRKERGHADITIRVDVCRIAGFVGGDIIRADAALDLREWDIAAVKREGADWFFVGRVVAVSPESITVRGDESEYTYDRAELAFEGRVKPEPIGRDDGLTDEQRDELAALRKKLDRLGGEDDQIIRCTARYELEKKIYDIEHPIAPPFDPDEWPEELRVIGE